MAKSVEIWICTIRNPSELMSLISPLARGCEDDQIMTGLVSVRIIYNGAELNSSELLLAESIFHDTLKNLSVKVDSSQPLSLSSARNFALNNSIADWGIYIDDDVILEPGFIKCALGAVDQADKYDCVLLGGKVELSGVPVGLEDIHRIFLSQLDYGTPSRVLDSEFVNGACFGLNRKEILGMSLQFSEQLGRKGSLLLSGEESLMISQVRRLGGRVWYENELRVNHLVEPERLSTSWLLKRVSWEAITASIIRANLGSNSRDSVKYPSYPSHDDVMNILKQKSLIESALDGDTRILHSFGPEYKWESYKVRLTSICRNLSKRVRASHFFRSTPVGKILFKQIRIMCKRFKD